MKRRLNLLITLVCSFLLASVYALNPDFQESNMVQDFLGAIPIPDLLFVACVGGALILLYLRMHLSAMLLGALAVFSFFQYPPHVLGYLGIKW